MGDPGVMSLPAGEEVGQPGQPHHHLVNRIMISWVGQPATGHICTSESPMKWPGTTEGHLRGTHDEPCDVLRWQRLFFLPCSLPWLLQGGKCGMDVRSCW